MFVLRIKLIKTICNYEINTSYLFFFNQAVALIILKKHYHLNRDVSTPSLCFSLYPPNLYVNDTPNSRKQE